MQCPNDRGRIVLPRPARPSPKQDQETKLRKMLPSTGAGLAAIMPTPAEANCELAAMIASGAAATAAATAATASTAATAATNTCASNLGGGKYMYMCSGAADASAALASGDRLIRRAPNPTTTTKPPHPFVGLHGHPSTARPSQDEEGTGAAGLGLGAAAVAVLPSTGLKRKLSEVVATRTVPTAVARVDEPRGSSGARTVGSLSGGAPSYRRFGTGEPILATVEPQTPQTPQPFLRAPSPFIGFTRSSTPPLADDPSSPGMKHSQYATRPDEFSSDSFEMLSDDSSGEPPNPAQLLRSQPDH